MRRFDVRANGNPTANGTGFCVIRLQQSLFGQHHRQRDAAESRPCVIEEAATVEHVMAVECVG